MKRIYIALALAFPLSAVAQKDTLKQETIDIISKYQPKLPNAAKLNLTASLPNVDTSRPRLGYQVPALNLYFMYQPVPIRPLALGKDTSSLQLQNNYVKLGYGNYNTPLIQAGFGSGRKDKYNFGVLFNYTSSKGDIQYQDVSQMNILGSGTYFTPLFEVNASLGYNRNQVYYYGYDHAVHQYDKSDVKQAFNEVVAKVGLKNRPQNDWGFQFQPQAEFTVFGDKYKRMENTFVLKAPIRKQIFEDIWLKAEGLVDLSVFKEDNNEQINNNIAAIHPAVEITKPGFVLHAGANPTWTNGKFHLLPDIVNESHLIREKLILSSGWISYFQKNNFRNLASENPWFNSYGPDMLNTRIEEKYTGIKGTLGNHFNYNTKFGAISWYNRQLFSERQYRRQELLHPQRGRAPRLPAACGSGLYPGREVPGTGEHRLVRFQQTEDRAEALARAAFPRQPVRAVHLREEIPPERQSLHPEQHLLRDAQGRVGRHGQNQGGAGFERRSGI
ncbi:hypothetical protein [Chitinophaga caseinilytica]|uniref:Uncharacterized protein n=1 Tax=Chitinophaga caseinilytica TaxID=2267521 RepID=A0ABZ2ZES2_9BACT